MSRRFRLPCLAVLTALAGACQSAVDARPELTWPELAPQSGPSADGVVDQPTYELRVWRLAGGVPAEPAYEVRGLAATSHRVAAPLDRENYDHAWCVRARFRLDGRTRVTPWWTSGGFDRSAYRPVPGSHLRRGRVR